MSKEELMDKFTEEIDGQMFVISHINEPVFSDEYVGWLENLVINQAKGTVNEDSDCNIASVVGTFVCPECGQPYITYTENEYYKCNSCEHTWAN